MSKILLIIGGIFNSLLAVFHVFLGYQIFQIKDMAEGYRALMIMLNAGGTLFIILFATASLGFATEMLTTRLGKLISLFVFLLYASRAIEEAIISPEFSLAIFAICIVIAAIYLVVWLLPHQKKSIITDKVK
ncbi:MAG: hypothetical protein ACOY90_15475 [Candidatus Zhuqueibacterota bacterium]